VGFLGERFCLYEAGKSISVFARGIICKAAIVLSNGGKMICFDLGDPSENVVMDRIFSPARV